MPVPSPLSLLALFLSLRLAQAGPVGVLGYGIHRYEMTILSKVGYYYYVNNILVGTPPPTEALVLNLQSSKLAFNSDECAFCPGVDLFNPSLSSTYNSTNQPCPAGTPQFNGVLAQDAVSFGGVLTSKDTPISLVEVMSRNFTARVLDGHFGLFVNSTNQQHILTRLHSTGQLLNPVVGLRFADTPETSQITIGALDPNDYEGTINWVQAETPDPTWDGPAVIQIDGIRGFNGSFLPYKTPMLSYLDAMMESIHVPNDWTYMSTGGYTGPVQTINVDPSGGLYGFSCNQTKAYVFLSVDINGVNYQIDSQDNLLHNSSGYAAKGFCNVGIQNLTSATSVQTSLGLPFLRSVYMAYRFPTEDCPNPYYGFAFPKGGNRTSTMIAQKPRVTPTDSAQCLSFATPTSTPSVSTPPPQASADKSSHGQTFKVWPNDNGQQVALKGADICSALAWSERFRMWEPERQGSSSRIILTFQPTYHN